MTLKTIIPWTAWLLLFMPSTVCFCQSNDRSAETTPSTQKTIEESVKPGINDKFVNPDLNVDSFVKKFEVESREVYVLRDAIVAACEIEVGDTVADVGAGTGLFSRLFL